MGKTEYSHLSHEHILSLLPYGLPAKFSVSYTHTHTPLLQNHQTLPWLQLWEQLHWVAFVFGLGTSVLLMAPLTRQLRGVDSDWAAGSSGVAQGRHSNQLV